MDVIRHGNIPLICGEFGLSPSQSGFSDYMHDVHAMFDRNLWNWSYWSNDNGGWSPLNADGSETAVLQHLIRTYPKATQGKIDSFSYDYSSRIFKMTYSANANIPYPTEIFVPNRFYPNGYNFALSGTANYTKTEITNKQMITVFSNENKTITIEITPR